MQSPVTILRHLFDVAVQRAQPLHTMKMYLPVPPNPALGRTLVLGAGKAAGAMAQALEVLWSEHAGADAPMSGLVVTRYGHIPPRHGERIQKALGAKAQQGVSQIVFIPWGHHLASDEIDFR